jgi:hypothetical protein
LTCTTSGADKRNYFNSLRLDFCRIKGIVEPRHRFPVGNSGRKLNMTASQQDTAEFTQRVLSGLMTEWADFKEHGKNIEAQILALAVANGLPGVLPDPAG